MERQKKIENYITRNGKKLYIKLSNGEGRLKYERICLNCGRDFISVRSTALYCCNSCRINAFKRDKKEQERKEWVEMQKRRFNNLK